MTVRRNTGMRQGYVAVLVCICGVASSPLLYKLAFASGIHALWVNVFRMLVTVVIMGCISLVNPKNRKQLLSVPKRTFWISALAGTLLALHFTGWALALAYTDTFAAAAIIGIYVLLTALFAAIFLREKISRSALTGLIIATAGVVVCNLGGGTGRLSGNMFALFAAVTEAFYILCGRKAQEKIGTITYTTILYSFTLFWMVVMALIFRAPVSFPSDGLLYSGLLAISATLLGHSMANVALKYFKAATVSAVMMSGAVTGPLIVQLVMQETPSVYTIIGGTIILLGLAWYMVLEQREAKRLAQVLILDE
jgi:drug/metabolite transporter (DMT)-like permease